MPTLRERREVLGWSRKQLAAAVPIDASVLQLVELGQWDDPEAIGKIEAALRAEEAKRAGSTGEA